MNEIKNGDLIVMDGSPFAVLKVAHSHVGRGGSNVTAKVKNIKTGQVLERTFKQSDEFEEADVEKIKAVFLYSHGRVSARGGPAYGGRIAGGSGPQARNSNATYWFNEPGNPKNRFSLSAQEVGDSAQFLKPNLEILAIQFEGKIIGIELPIKVDYIVKEAPPAVKGNTAQAGTKTAVLETGVEILTPLFISEGDIVRVNTTTGEYVERVRKAQ